MIYTRKELQILSLKEPSIPLIRYMHKYNNNEFKKLKMHEKDFFFQHIKLLYVDKGCNIVPAFNLRKIKEAEEYLFYTIILTYTYSYVDFDSASYNYRGKIPANEIRKDKRFFYEYINKWKNQVSFKKGPYFSEIYIAINQKIKGLKTVKENTRISLHSYKKKCMLIWAVFFHIYYKAKIYYDEKKKKYDEIMIDKFIVRFDIYSFIHIMSRHYYPNMNLEAGISLNSKLSIINMEELPISVLNLIKQHTSFSYLTQKTEFLLFEIDGEKYIIWIKFKNVENNAIFQVRSFYKCKEQRDLNKFCNKRKFVLSDKLVGYY